MKKNDIITLEITGMTSEGSGVGRHDGMAVFVSGATVGDILEVLIIKAKKTYAIGKINKIVKPSDDRIEPDCEVFSKCGGCCYRHITYESELEIKRERVQDCLTRIGGFDDLKVSEILGDTSRCHYRNKAQLPIGQDKNGNIIVGFYAERSHRIIPNDSCLLQPPEFSDIISAFFDWQNIAKESVYNEETGNGKLRHLYIREGTMTGEIMVCLVINGKSVRHEDKLIQIMQERVPGLKSLVINSNTEKTNVILGEKCRTIFGSDTITDILCGKRFEIAPLSFYQVNRNQAEVLYNKAREFAELKGDEVLLDLYCGAGTIGLTMADSVKELIGVEIIPEAIENAKNNAKLNNIENAEFICGDASLCAEDLAGRGIEPDVIIVDPPRKGLTPELIDTIAEMNPDRIVYVSCDPATLARDLKLLDQKGFKPEKAAAVDLFSGTRHIESVVKLTRQ